MATIFERYPGKWYLKFRLNCKQILKHVGNTRSEAMAALKSYKDTKSLDNLTKAGIITAPRKKPEKPRILFTKLAILYGNHCSTKAATTEAAEIRRINTHFLPLFGNLYLDEITAAKIEAWKQKRLKEGVTSRTIHNDLRVLKTMFNRAIEWDLFQCKNPVGKLPRIFNKEMQFLTSQKAQEYLAACPKYYYPIAAVLICTGMRTGELLELKWSDIDFENKIINIRSTASLKNEEGRSIPIFPELIPILNALPKNSEYVFPGEDGKSKRVHFRRGHHIARKKIGMPELRIHDLRHTFITLLLEKGNDIPAVSKLAGHKSTKITVSIYHHLHPERARTIIDGLPIKLTAPEPDSQKEE